MLPVTKNYELYPSIVKADEKNEMTVIPTERAFLLFENREYSIEIIPRNGNEPYYYIPEAFEKLSVKAQNGIIRFDYTFNGEQEYLIYLTCDERVIGEFHVYSLYPDLYSLKALKGDLHSHSCRSDGARDPSALAGHFREQGYDFYALTDHNRYYPGEEADEVYRGIKCGITRVLGEEVHAPPSTLHVVHIGGRSSVASLYIESRELYERERAEYISRVPDSVPEEYAERYAETQWACDRIHEAGGLAIFPHPYWIPKGRVYNLNDEFAKIILKSGMFDAFELMGGATVSGNNRNVALLSELQRDGFNISVVGSSDVHGLDNVSSFPHYFTVCFATDNTSDAIAEAVRQGLSVAVEGVGEEYKRQYRAYGSLRLVSYAQFLLTYYFPERIRMCAGEGIAMRYYSMGMADASLIELNARLNEEFADRYFGRLAPVLPSQKMLEFEEKWRRVQTEKGPNTRGGAV